MRGLIMCKLRVDLLLKFWLREGKAINMNEITIPLLPCASIDDMVEFYTALGFELTYRQARPNNYACVKRDDIHLHFFTMKGYEPENSYSSCVVVVDDANALHSTFVDNLRSHFGKLPVAGIPRITRPSRKNWGGDYRFNIIDPGGNYMRFVQQNSVADEGESSEDAPLTKVGRIIKGADLLVNGKMDFPAAATMLDKLLTQNRDEMTAVEKIRALVLRTEVALNLADKSLARTLIEDIRQLSLNDDERVLLADELERANEMAQLIS